MRTNILIPFLLLAAFVSLLSCRWGAKPSATATPEPNLALDGAALRERAWRTVAAVTSYRFDQAVSAKRAIKRDNESVEIHLSLWSKVALDLDIAAGKMRMQNSLNVKLPPDQPAPPMIENAIYIIGDTMYLFAPGEPQPWVKTKVGEDYWKSQNQAKQQMELLKLSEVELLPPETIRSGNAEVASNVLLVTPPLEKFWELIARQPGVNLPPQPPPGVALSQIVRGAQMKMWLDQATGLPLKAEMRSNLYIDPAIVTGASGELSIDIVITTLFYDYNQPVSIELPPEAQQAIEWTGEGTR